MTTTELEERLIDFAVNIISFTNDLLPSKASSHLSSQIIRSSTSCPLNYGEAQSAESRKDFIHKLKVVTKELRETYICLRIMKKAKLFSEELDLEKLIQENNSLLSIFVRSVKTAEIKNLTR